MATIFISYSQVDRERTRPLADFLKASGYKVWWDVGLRPGDNFTIEIQQQIQKADHVIVIWTRASAASFWVTAEVTYARTCGKAIMPLRLDDCSPPVPFNLLQTKDLGPIERDGPDIVAALVAAGTIPLSHAAVLQAGDAPIAEKILRKAQELARWEFIKGSSKAEPFRTFLQRFPDGELADLATMRLESLRWEEISRTRTTEELRGFLAEFPHGVKGPEARRILERRERIAEYRDWSRLRGGIFNWRRKQPDRMLADYEQFLALHPYGDHAPQARAVVERLREEIGLWRQASSASDRSAVERYLTEFPSGSFISEAKAHRSRLNRQLAPATDGSALSAARGDGQPHLPIWTFLSLAILAALLGTIGAHLGSSREVLVALPFRFIDGEIYYFLHPYPVFIGLFVAVLIHEWGNRSWRTTIFAFVAILVFRSASQVMGLEEDMKPGLPVNSMLIGSLYCFGAWVAGFIVAPYMRRSVPLFVASIVLGALCYPDWFVALAKPVPGHEMMTAALFFVACTMPIAYSLLRATPRRESPALEPAAVARV